MPYVEVDVDTGDFDDDDLISELESRGWWVSPEKNWKPIELNDEHKDWICEKIRSENLDLTDMTAKEIYDELRKKQCTLAITG